MLTIVLPRVQSILKRMDVIRYFNIIDSMKSYPAHSILLSFDSTIRKEQVCIVSSYKIAIQNVLSWPYILK